MPLLRALLSCLMLVPTLSVSPLPSSSGVAARRAPPARKVVRPSPSPSVPLSFDARSLLAGNWSGSARLPPASSASAGAAASTAAASAAEDDTDPLPLAPPQACALSLAVSPGAAADQPLTGALVCGGEQRAWRVEFLSASGERGAVWEQAVSAPAGRKAKWGKVCEFAWDAAGSGAALHTVMDVIPVNISQLKEVIVYFREVSKSTIRPSYRHSNRFKRRS